MGRSSPRKVSGSVRASRPYEGTTSGRADTGTPKRAHSCSLHDAVVMSYSRVREALVASVTWKRPRDMRATRYESTVPIAVRPDSTELQTCGSLARIHASLVAEK
jgi:hypothetical protein